MTEHQPREWSEDEVQAIFDKAPIVVYVKDLEGRFTFVNRSFEELLGMPRGFFIGKTDADFLPPEVVVQNRANDRAALEAGFPLESEETIPLRDGPHVYLTSKFALHSASGSPYAICGIATDITARKHAEAERSALARQILETQHAAELQSRLIEAQHAMLRELSTPLLPIADGVVVMPLVGAIDPARAALVLEALLVGVVAHRAEVAILDITGVRTVDAQMAGGLVQAAKAAGLLGAEVLLTGVRPSAAQALVELDVDTRGIVTLSTLQQGVAHALTRSRRRRTR